MNYLAPEIRKQFYKKYNDISIDKLKPDIKSKPDIFSLGLIMLQIILKNKDTE